jgi:hypothetical protein
MRGILADINIQGHLAILLRVWESEEWREIWEHLALSLHTFEEWGLEQNTPDDVIWRECQARQVVLLTANRNDDGPDSLEATIRNHNAPSSLPVFTFANAARIQHESRYAGQVAIKLLQYFLEIDSVRGAGRMYVP